MVSVIANAQDRFVLFLKADTVVKELKLQEKYLFNSSEKRTDFLSDLIFEMRANNWLEASLDSVFTDEGDTMTAFLHVGNKYSFSGKLPPLLGEDVKRKGKLKSNEGISNLPGVLVEIDRQLNYFQEHGYPFASISWDSIAAGKDSLQMQGKVDKGPFIIIDSVINKGDAKISQSYLKSYLGIKKMMPYRESILRETDQLLQKLPFIKLTQPSAVYFNNDKASLQLFLEKRKVSRFDFLIGILPNNTGSGKILITGEAKIQLLNAFKQGEEIFLEWKRVQQNSQQLKVRFNYPFILQSPIGVSGQFHLDKRDSTFVDLLANFGVPIRTRANNYIKGFVESRQTIVLQVDTNFVKQFKRLPLVQNVGALMYGFEGYYENLDYMFNPTRGFEARASFQVGNKRIKPNSTILNLERPGTFPYSSLYDSIKTKSLQMQVKWLVNGYIPLSARNIIKAGFQGQAIINNNNIQQNELLRIGGNRLLRGFDEESIFVEHYALATLEYRFLLEQNSYLYTFFDAAYTGRKNNGQYQNDFPFGFGAGMAFETKAGIFGISYALGRQLGNSLDFRSSKIHFGYVNVF